MDVAGSQLLRAANWCRQSTVASSRCRQPTVASSGPLPAADARGFTRLTHPTPPRQMAADKAAAAVDAEVDAEEVDILAGMGLSAEEVTFPITIPSSSSSHPHHHLFISSSRRHLIPRSAGGGGGQGAGDPARQARALAAGGEPGGTSFSVYRHLCSRTHTRRPTDEGDLSRERVNCRTVAGGGRGRGRGGRDRRRHRGRAGPGVMAPSR